jgi:hypothetical protein
MWKLKKRNNKNVKGKRKNKKNVTMEKEKK